MAMIPKTWWWTGLVGLVIVASLPFVGHALRDDRETRCNWDGLEIEPIYQVRILDAAGATQRYCCLGCAESWLQRSGHQPVGIFVTDEASGAELDPSEAIFVRSTVTTNEVTGNRRHVFRHEDDALKHIDAAHGRRLLGAERPFAKMESADSGASAQ